MDSMSDSDVDSEIDMILIDNIKNKNIKHIISKLDNINDYIEDIDRNNSCSQPIDLSFENAEYSHKCNSIIIYSINYIIKHKDKHLDQEYTVLSNKIFNKVDLMIKNNIIFDAMLLFKIRVYDVNKYNYLMSLKQHIEPALFLIGINSSQYYDTDPTFYQEMIEYLLQPFVSRNEICYNGCRNNHGYLIDKRLTLNNLIGLVDSFIVDKNDDKFEEYGNILIFVLDKIYKFINDSQPILFLKYKRDIFQKVIILLIEKKENNLLPKNTLDNFQKINNWHKKLCNRKEMWDDRYILLNEIIDAQIINNEMIESNDNIRENMLKNITQTDIEQYLKLKEEIKQKQKRIDNKNYLLETKSKIENYIATYKGQLDSINKQLVDYDDC